MFVEGKNTDKIVNTYDRSPFIRITWLNEPKDKRFDAAFFKAWADGECNAEKLYAEGSHDFKHYSLTFLTANNMPNIQVDGGTKRRLKACPHNSKFVDSEDLVDEENHVYLKDEDFKPDFEKSTDLKNAFFSLLATRAHEWLKTKKVNVPDSFKELTNTIIESNDHVKDFIDGKLEITNNQSDRIGKHRMLELYSEMYPNKDLQLLQLQTLLKERGIKYDRQLRANGIQGCFYGIKEKEANDEVNEDYDYGIDKTDKSVKLTLDEQIKHYEKLLEDLYKLKTKEVEPKPKPKVGEEPKKYFAKFPVKKPNNKDEKPFSMMFSFVYHKKNQTKNFMIQSKLNL
jgi:hypothetical protein